VEVERAAKALLDGEVLPMVRMERPLEALPSKLPAVERRVLRLRGTGILARAFLWSHQ